MSVVCAKVYDNEIVIAADSIAVSGWSKFANHPAKLSRIEGMIAGIVGDAAFGCLLFHYMTTHKPSEATERAVIDFFVEFVKWAKAYTDKAVFPVCIFAYGGKVFYIEDMYVWEVKEHCAIGAGRDFANAALYLGHTPEEAVKVACDLSCYVAEPIVVERMERKE